MLKTNAKKRTPRAPIPPKTNKGRLMINKPTPVIIHIPTIRPEPAGIRIPPDLIFCYLEETPLSHAPQQPEGKRFIPRPSSHPPL